MIVRAITDGVIPVADGACLSCKDLGQYGKSRTVQSHREACDIPAIVAKFKRTGILPTMRATASSAPVFGDFTDVVDYQAACNRVIAAQQAFADLPVRVRERFNHDPASLLTFIANPENRDEAIALGLIEKPVEVLPKIDASSVKKAGDVAAADAKGV